MSAFTPLDRSPGLAIDAVMRVEEHFPMEQACICALQAAHVYVGEMHMITFTFADFSCSGQFHGVPSHVCAQLLQHASWQ